MKTISNVRKVMLVTWCLFVPYLLIACGSTDEPIEAAECRSSVPETCETENEEQDRGYDPCLINKNLPVCKS